MNFVCHHYLQNNFCPKNNLNQVFLAFFSSFSTSRCLFLFLVTVSLMPFNLKSNSGFLIKSVCAANLALKTSAAKVLNSGVVIYLP